MSESDIVACFTVGLWVWCVSVTLLGFHMNKLWPWLYYRTPEGIKSVIAIVTIITFFGAISGTFMYFEECAGYDDCAPYGERSKGDE